MSTGSERGSLADQTSIEGDHEGSLHLWQNLQLEIAGSEVRDHLSNERTFMSTMKLSLYLGIVGAASLLSFRLPENSSNTRRGKPGSGGTKISDNLVMPLAFLFFFLAVANLISGTLNYYQTQKRYASNVPFVQEHWLLRVLVVFIGICIILGCFILIEDDEHFP